MKICFNNRMPMCTYTMQCRRQQNAQYILSATLCESIDQTTQFSIKSCRIIIQKLEIILWVLQWKFNFNNVDYFVWQMKSFGNVLNGLFGIFFSGGMKNQSCGTWIECILLHLNKWNILYELKCCICTTYFWSFPNSPSN